MATNERIVAERSITEPRAHASIINVFIDEVMQESGLFFSQIDAVAVSKGPGSYTGLRIGVSTAKGICYAINKPLISIGSLHSYTAQFILSLSENENKHEDGLYVPMIDARRMEVYTAIFDGHLKQLLPVQAIVLEDNIFKKMGFANPMYLFGNGASKYLSFAANNPMIGVTADFVPNTLGMSMLAFEKFNNGQFEDLAYFEPLYLKEFVTQSAFR